jgi:hypothetical protein
MQTQDQWIWGIIELFCTLIVMVSLKIFKIQIDFMPQRMNVIVCKIKSLNKGTTV